MLRYNKTATKNGKADVVKADGYFNNNNNKKIDKNKKLFSTD